MKKKIKDLTFFEISEICSKRKRCTECPLYIKGVYVTARCIISILHSSLINDRGNIIEEEVDI